MAHAGIAIRTTRESLGLTLRELAHMSDTSYAYLSQVETGRRVPSDRWLRDVSEALASAMHEARRTA